MTKSLQYISSNADVPFGLVSSTARKGHKWYAQVEIGDVVNLEITQTGEVFGQAAIVAKELVTYRDVLDNADHNHVAYTTVGNPRLSLENALCAAYGSGIQNSAEFTVLHILPLGRGAWEFPAVEPHVIDVPPSEPLGDIMSNCGDAGAAWSAEFCKLNPGADFGTMLCWFCNAIETSYSKRIAEQEDGDVDVEFEALIEAGLDADGAIEYFERIFKTGDVIESQRVGFRKPDGH